VPSKCGKFNHDFNINIRLCCFNLYTVNTVSLPNCGWKSYTNNNIIHSNNNVVWITIYRTRNKLYFLFVINNYYEARRRIIIMASGHPTSSLLQLFLFNLDCFLKFIGF